VTVTKENIFKPGKLSSQDKAAVTDATAKGIVAAETTARDRKTEQLKRLRLEREASAPPSGIKSRRGKQTSRAR
jgi:hypothetical protein